MLFEPEGVVTTTSTVPATWAGVTQVIVFAEATFTEVHENPPKVTEVAPLKFTPVIVTSVPPRIVPEDGLRLLIAGSGDSPTREDVALINYVGTLPDGKQFDKGKNAVLPLAEVVPGFAKALAQMQRGGKYKVVIPSELAYGDRAVGEIPANTDLHFEIELLDFKSRAEIEQQQAMMQQQLQQMQQQGAGAPPPRP